MNLETRNTIKRLIENLKREASDVGCMHSNWDDVFVLQRLLESGWQPLETAPRDGRHLLLYTPGDGGSVMGTEYDDQKGYIFTGCYAEDGFWYCLEYTAFPHEPTHWMPLPDPPEDPCA